MKKNGLPKTLVFFFFFLSKENVHSFGQNLTFHTLLEEKGIKSMHWLRAKYVIVHSISLLRKFAFRSSTVTSPSSLHPSASGHLSLAKMRKWTNWKDTIITNVRISFFNAISRFFLFSYLTGPGLENPIFRCHQHNPLRNEPFWHN